MTHKEAVEILEVAKTEYFGEIRCAFEMAINALKAKETSIERVAADYGLTVDGISFALDQYQTVICEITNSRLSKLSYNSSDILSVANDVKCEGCELLETQEPRGAAYWIPCKGKSHLWYCSHYGDKVNYNNAHSVYQTGKRPIEQVNRFCRGCGYKMTSRQTDAQREALEQDG